MPPLSWFRAFESAARHLSFTKAAQELGVTQSAISQNIRSLEMQLGTPLFIRKPRALALTDSGRNLLPDISLAISKIQNATKAFQHSEAEGSISIMTSPSFAQWILAPNLHKFTKEHPHTQLRLITSIWPDEYLVSSADIEVRYGSKTQVGKGANRILPDELILVASPHLGPINSGEEINLADHHPVIEVQGTANSLKDWIKACEYSTDIQGSIFVDNYGLAIDLALQNVGIALVSSLIAAPLLKNGDLIKLGPYAQIASDGYFLAVNKKAPEIDAFILWLNAEISTMQTESAS